MKNRIKEKMLAVFTAKVLRAALVTLGIIVAVLIVFQAGVMVGFRKASFGKTWDEHYLDNFEPVHPTFGGMPEKFPSAHGTFGRIVSVSLPQIVVTDRDNTEKTIMISPDTRIRDINSDVTSDALTPDITIVAIGEPNADGQIVAKFIRILPEPPVQTPTAN